MRLKSPQATSAFVFVSFALVAILQSWPLVLHLSTQLTGPPGGDTGVYVWNTWVFGHEVLDLGHQPYATESIFSSDLPANLSLHNYTPFADVIAMALHPMLGVIGAFNVIYLFNAALAGFGMYLLASRHTPDRVAAWLAGLLFGCAPFLVARSLGHFSLAAAAPLPFFVWQLERTLERPGIGRAIVTGLIAAWAGMSDPYYLVYCLMLGTAVVLGQYLRVTTRPFARLRVISRSDIALACGIAVVAALAATGPIDVRLGPVHITMHSLYTPVLLLTLMLTARMYWRLRPSFGWIRRPTRQEWQLGGVAVASACVALFPWLASIVRRIMDDAMTSAPVLWRSSMPGVDLLSLFVPNPFNPMMPARVRDVMATQPGGLLDQVASLPLVALAVIAIARTQGARLSRWWIATTVFFALLALGPFVTIAGMNTHIPTPWTFLRYVPVIDQARAPSRFAVVAVMGLAVLFAQAFAAWRRRTAHLRTMTMAVSALLAIELLPAPRTLYSAAIPSIYAIVANDPRPVSVLELPFGLRDGLSSVGNFTARSQFYQTYHHKPLFGGYLSRISTGRKLRVERRPFLGALLRLSQGEALSPAERQRAEAAALAFIEQGRPGYVIIDRSRSPAALREFAISALRLQKIATSGMLDLYVPAGSSR
jgi:hypothetical protein